MSKIRLVALFVVVVIVITCASVCAGKITLDPNLSGEQKSSDQAQVDARLSQKMTYDSGYKRLNEVAEDITRISGVSIACGSSKKDWQARDIPVVVCVKDMPLGKLLKAIAAATHMRVTSEKIGNDPKLIYRIYRNKKEQDAIDNYLLRRHEAKLQEIKWQWDAMTAYGNSSIKWQPDAMIDKGNPKEHHDSPKGTLLIAKLIATLGAGEKDKMLNGDTFRFSGKDPAYQAIMNELYQLTSIDLQICENNDNTPVVLPTQDDAEASALQIKLLDTVDSGDAKIEVVLTPIAWGNGSSIFYSSTLEMVRTLENKEVSLPPYPEESNPSDDEDMDNPNMILLKKWQDWDHTLLKKKINIEKPKNIKDPTFADAVRAVASASGCNIVVDDFTSHMDPKYRQIDNVFKDNTTLADSLRRAYIGDRVGYKWFFNASDKLIVGWTDIYPHNWRDTYRDLLPVDYLASLKNQLEGSGVEFDDAIHISMLPGDSFDTWFFYSRGFTCLDPVERCSDNMLWRLYDSLESSDKQLAKSKDGLPLAKFDTAWIAGFFHMQKMSTPLNVFENPRKEANEQEMQEESKLIERVMSDPLVISTMIMRVQKLPAETRNGKEHKAGNTTDIPKLYTYKMVVNYRIDGEDKTITADGPSIAFPAKSLDAKL